MIKIVAENFVIEDKMNEFIGLANKLIEETRKEKGCLSYVLFENLNDKCNLTFIEEWVDLDAIKKHNESKHFTELVPQLGNLCYKEGRVNLFVEMTGN